MDEKNKGAAAAAAAAEELQLRQEGTTVRIHGLVNTKQHNGKIGTVVVGTVIEKKKPSRSRRGGGKRGKSRGGKRGKSRKVPNDPRVGVKLQDGSEEVLSVKMENLELVNTNRVFSEWNNLFLCRHPGKHDYRMSQSSGEWLPEVTILQDIDEINKFDALSLAIPLVQSVAPVLSRSWNVGDDNLFRAITDMIEEGDGQIQFSKYIACFQRTDPKFPTSFSEGDFERYGDVHTSRLYIFDRGFGGYDETKKGRADILLNEQVCPICFENISADDEPSFYRFGDLYRFPCEHAFHKKCLEMWRQSHPSAGLSCPQCNAPLPTKVIQRSIQIPDAKHWTGGRKFKFSQNLFGNDQRIMWDLSVPPNMHAGDIMSYQLTTNGELVRPEPSPVPIEAALRRKLARNTRGVETQKTSVVHNLDSDPRYFEGIRQVDCEDCGCNDSWDPNNDADDTALRFPDCDKIDFEEILSSAWKDNKLDFCSSCRRSWARSCAQNWRYYDSNKAWRLFESDVLESNSLSNNFIATLPPLFEFELTRWRFRKATGTMMINFTDISFPQVFEVRDYVPEELRNNVVFSENPPSTTYNLRFVIIRKEQHLNLSNLNDVNVPADKSGGRYVYWFRSLCDNQWYEFDVCKPIARPLNGFDDGSRMSSQVVCGLTYVRQDLDAPIGVGNEGISG